MLQPIKGKRKSPRRIMLMGTNYVGKSTLAAQAEGVFFIDCENGLDDIDCERTPVASSIDTVFEWMVWLGQKEQDYQWLAIDALESVERLIQDKVVKDKNAKSFGDPCFDYGRGRKLCQPYWDRFYKGIKWLQSEKRMGVIFCTHVESVEVKPPNAEAFHRFEPPLDKEARETICDWCTEIFFLSFRELTRTQDDGFNRERKIAIDCDRERLIRTQPTTGIRAKNRLGMPEEIPFNDPREAWSIIKRFMDSAGHEQAGNINGVVVNGSSKQQVTEVA